MTAAHLLRASVAALPENYRHEWWSATTGDVYSGSGSGGDRWIAESDRAAQHIALVASPNRVLALADHDDAMRRLRDRIANADLTQPIPAAELLADVLRTHDRWAALIEGDAHERH